ncbi:uncharacterized protein B0I36DRAFT_233192 [Microdochium trichocladiopsis]|uniref:Uncharacterized protein n=1 Tax=Microdochium trichocladiopsis TaxID=1682393 RepID=A0A9P9BX92_9PEZI|nr:uncharacterized protein B0I36DRAFT_233192 [Microdochium trichocladiopsis]KAH7041355.1 hypothetical protein B0I36DRAFT_233192 [Microdochium trichocladiopsis]
MDVNEKDSPLSVTANIAGILTFLVAIVAAVYARLTYLRNSDQEYFRVKTSLSWYKTESTWLSELVRASAPLMRPARSPSAFSGRTQHEMYTFVMDDLIKLEQRLLDLVEETEVRAAQGNVPQLSEDQRRDWTLVPSGWGFTTSVALAWLPVRSKALDLVRQRDALTARVSFTQMSMIASRISDLEHRSATRDAVVDRTLKKLEAIIHHQSGEIHRLEDKLYRIMHRHRVEQEDDPQP